MNIRERISNTAIVAFRLALCPGDDIFMIAAQISHTSDTNNFPSPAAILYESPKLTSVRRKDSRGNEVLITFPDLFPKAF